jgi:hypothetical protein
MEHRRFVADLLEEYGVPELEEGHTFGDHVDGRGLPVTGNHTYTARDTAPLLEVCLASRIKLFANALGVAPPDVIEAFHERDVLVAGLAGTPRHGVKRPRRRRRFARSSSAPARATPCARARRPAGRRASCARAGRTHGRAASAARTSC